MYINCVFVMSCLTVKGRRLSSDGLLESGVSVISRVVAQYKRHLSEVLYLCHLSEVLYLCHLSEVPCTSLYFPLSTPYVDKTANTEQFVCFALVPVSVAMPLLGVNRQ